MPNVGAKGIIRYEETFLPYKLGTGVQGLDRGTETGAITMRDVAWVQNIGTTDTPFALTPSAARGLCIAGSLAATDNNTINLQGYPLMFYAQTGFNAIDVLFQLDQASAVAVNFGFMGLNTGSNNLLPVQLTTATWASTGSTFCGLVYDADATNDEFHCFWTNDNTDTVTPLGDLRMKGMSLVKDKWCYMRVELQDTGSGNSPRATFHVEQDGKHATKEFNTNLTRSQNLAFYFGVGNRDGLARGVYVRRPSWEQSIAD